MDVGGVWIRMLDVDERAMKSGCGWIIFIFIFISIDDGIFV